MPPAPSALPDRAALPAGAAFDAAAPWRLHPQVSLRPEPFGALAYHFGTRRLSFLKTRRLVDVVQALATRPDALGVCRAAGVPDAELPVYLRALASLAGSGMICRREPGPVDLAPEAPAPEAPAPEAP
ncbi:MAG: mycofactocin biosynthesis chaperone MftB, partial [Acidimicrobiales bacterium]